MVLRGAGCVLRCWASVGASVLVHCGQALGAGAGYLYHFSLGDLVLVLGGTLQKINKINHLASGQYNDTTKRKNRAIETANPTAR